MKLRLTRNQVDQKGLFGGHKGVSFSLNYKLDMSDEERELIAHYKVGDMIVHEYPGWFRQGQPVMLQISVNGLANGGSLSFDDLGKISDAQNAIVSGANTLKGLIQQMHKFGGEEVIDI